MPRSSGSSHRWPFSRRRRKSTSTSFLRSDIKSSGMFFVAFVSVPLLIWLSGFENKGCISWYAATTTTTTTTTTAATREKISTNFRVSKKSCFFPSCAIDAASLRPRDLRQRWSLDKLRLVSDVQVLEMGFRFPVDQTHNKWSFSNLHLYPAACRFSKQATHKYPRAHGCYYTFAKQLRTTHLTCNNLSNPNGQ